MSPPSKSMRPSTILRSPCVRLRYGERCKFPHVALRQHVLEGVRKCRDVGLSSELECVSQEVRDTCCYSQGHFAVAQRYYLDGYIARRISITYSCSSFVFDSMCVHDKHVQMLRPGNWRATKNNSDSRRHMELQGGGSIEV